MKDSVLGECVFSPRVGVALAEAIGAAVGEGLAMVAGGMLQRERAGPVMGKAVLAAAVTGVAWWGLKTLGL